ncbi:MAG: YkgJ family cysteine cluster protein [Bacteroidetes bacterium]|jgi:Fe-S-cluster containining protein|nr:YkgJ family cysteine cluster protein [Bacteroidota bacterium]MDF1865221.1 YkgJ family cysteine cluster protein [Saprospiraceae bacterium]
MSLIEQWKKGKANVRKKHKKFTQKLKREKGKKLNELGDELHEQVFSEVDCLECANCCTSIPPIVNKTDATRISKHLGMKLSEFQKEYLIQDEDGDTVMNTSPCRFLLENNHCMIYEFRPKACREYPHTDAFEFAKNLHLHAVNARYCPAVFHILERMAKVI